MTLFRIVYHIIAAYVDGMGVHTDCEVGGPAEVVVVASSQANALTALAATVTCPDNGSVQILSCNPDGSSVIVGS